MDYKKTLIIVIAFVLGIILFFFNPEDTVWFPKCPFYLITGYQCPSCGIQRAMYHLLHLDFNKAFSYNPFLILSIPYAVALIVVTWFDSNNKLKRLRDVCYSKITVYLYVILTIIWWIVRN